jgi:ATP/maltotriose-dependent transcriptional regulator MalT
MLLAACLWGEAHVDEGLAYVPTLRDQPGQTLLTSAIIQAHEGALLAISGRIEPALELARESMHIARDLDPGALNATASAAAQVHLARGDLEEAVQSFTEAIEVLRDCGELAYASTMLGWKAALLLEQGHQDEEARRVLAEAAAVTSPYDSTSVGFVETCRAVLAARSGDHAEAATRASKALLAIDTGDQICQQADIRRWLSEVACRRGDVVGQRRLLVEARDLYRAKGYLPLLAATEQLLS